MGMLTVKATLTAITAVPPALIVSFIGIHLKNRINETIFRRVVLVVIMGVGIIGMVSYFTKLYGS